MKRNEQITLSCEDGFTIQGPGFPWLRKALRHLKPIDGHSFCIAEAGASYVQAIRGTNGYHVEWRESSLADIKTSRHWKAGRPGPLGPLRPCTKGDTEISGFESELLTLEDAIAIFRSHYAGQPRPTAYAWRELELP